MAANIDPTIIRLPRTAPACEVGVPMIAPKMKANTRNPKPINAVLPARLFLWGDCTAVRSRLQCWQTVASSWISPAQNGHFFIDYSPFASNGGLSLNGFQGVVGEDARTEELEQGPEQRLDGWETTEHTYMHCQCISRLHQSQSHKHERDFPGTGLVSHRMRPPFAVWGGVFFTSLHLQR
jgi:hypothetical protein